MGLDTGQSSIGKREATLRIAVWTSARESDEQMDAVGMDARRGRNRLHEVLQKSEGQIPGGTARYLPAVNLTNWEARVGYPADELRRAVNFPAID